MMTERIFSALFVAMFAVPVTAQEPAPNPPVAPSPDPSVDELITRLGDPQHNVRQEAEATLRARGNAAVDALRVAADKHADAEVRWRARRLLRQIEHGDGDGNLRPRQQAPDDETRDPGSHDLNDQFDALFRRLETDFGMDVPRQRFFSDDFFQDLQQQMDAMRGRLGPGGQGHGMQLQISPDRVRLEVTERGEDGKEQQQVYEAPDLDAFRQKYPDVAKRYLDSDGPNLRLGPRGLGQMVPPRLPGLTPRNLSGDPDGPRLGVYVRALSEDMRTFLGLAENQGLLIESLVDDSLATQLGLRAGDVLLTIDGKTVGSTQDVQEALRAASDKVRVTINRRGTEQTLEAAMPKSAPSEEPRKLRARAAR